MPRQLGQQRLRRASRAQVGTLTLGPSTVLDFSHKQSPLGARVFDNPKQITRLNVKTVAYIYNTYLPLVRDYSKVVLCTRGFFLSVLRWFLLLICLRPSRRFSSTQADINVYGVMLPAQPRNK